MITVSNVESEIQQMMKIMVMHTRKSRAHPTVNSKKNSWMGVRTDRDIKELLIPMSSIHLSIYIISNRILALKYFPYRWKAPEIIIIPKPGKHNILPKG